MLQKMADQSFGLASRVTLNNGLTMPRVHLGVYLMSGGEASSAVRHALDCGYRAFDSAQTYRNEREVGQAILEYVAQHPELTREDVHFTSKLNRNADYDAVRKSISRSVRECGLGYIDLFLLHSPYGGKKKRLESWRAVEDAVADGEVRIAGVSNFGVKHIDELLSSNPRVKPAVNQVEVSQTSPRWPTHPNFHLKVHPFNTRTEVVSHCKSHSILIEAYAPLARALRMKHPTIVSLSKKYTCDPGQLLVRWSLQHGYVPLPKSVKKERIRLNGDVGGLEISEVDMRTMDALDERLCTDWDPTDAP